MDLRQKIKEAQSLSTEGQVIFWHGVIEKYYEHAYSKGKSDTKKIRRLNRDRVNSDEESFFKEMKYLKTHPYIEDEYLKALNKNIPDEVHMLRNTLKITLQDIADMTKKEADAIHDAALMLKQLVYRITNETDKK